MTTKHAPRSPEYDFIMYSASQLIEEIAWEGPGGALEVRTHHLPTGASREGLTHWSSDIVGGGPAVLYYDKPDDPDFVAGALSLGGRTHFLPGFTHTNPVDPRAEGEYGFEILS